MRKRVIVGTALAVGLVFAAGCGGGDEDNGQAASSTPQVGQAKLVRAPDGSPSRVVASIPVTYHAASGENASHHVKVSGNVEVKDQTGDTHSYPLQVSPDSEQVFPQPGGKSVVHAHQYLAPAGATAVTAAIDRGDDVKVDARAEVATNTGGSPAPEAHSTSESVGDVNGLVPADDAVSAEQAESSSSGENPPGDVHGGADPCDSWSYGPANACQNVPGSEWTTDHFWASNTQKIHCPSGFGPVTYLNVLGVPFVQWGIVAGTSKFTSVAVGDQDSGSITITNDNTDGHHHSFTPVLLCCSPTNNPMECNGEQGGAEAVKGVKEGQAGGAPPSESTQTDTAPGAPATTTSSTITETTATGTTTSTTAP
jgi:hypothetical protein